MKTTIQTTLFSLLLAAFLFTAQHLSAQQRGQRGPPPLPNDDQIEKMVEHLAEELSLTSDQEKKVSKIYFSHFEEVEKKMEAGRPERKEMEALRTSLETDVKAVLTDDQKPLYDAFVKKQKQERPKR